MGSAVIQEENGRVLLIPCLNGEKKAFRGPQIPVAYFLPSPILEGLLLSNCEFFHSYKKNHRIYGKAPLYSCSSFVVYHSLETSLICFL